MTNSATNTPVSPTVIQPQQGNSKTETQERCIGKQGNIKPRVGLFVTCLVNLFRPSIGMAAARLLEDAGCEIAVPAEQVCCGQPAYNSGDNKSAAAIAKQIIVAFEAFDYVVGPSGSCMATIKSEYPKLLADDPEWAARATNLAERSYELFDFLTNVLHAQIKPVTCNGTATYHDSCSGLRTLHVKEQPRQLLANVDGLKLVEMQDAETCCGFGGTFCVKYPAISVKMADDKLANVAATEADYLLGGDLGCLLNLAGRMTRTGSPVKVYHAAEVLVGIGDQPAIGRSSEK